MADDKRFYITTPIYYPNGEPHLGHVYTTVCADVAARWHRLLGKDVHFLTGTDEHGIKMVKTAAEQGITPLELATKNADVFRETWKTLGITNNDFIRTSEDRHKLGCQEIVRRMLATGDIYLGHYEGWYDEGQEEFITETEAKNAEFKSAINGKPLVRYKEPGYFFKLTKYVDQVFKAISEDQIEIRPQSRKNEILSKLKGWDQDLSISRASLTWGIPMPNDPTHVLYVWIDALSNYVTALDWPAGDGKLFEKYWPADAHLIGKEILWFHAFYWPAMLLALEQRLPRKLFAHGWWTSDGKKMSKTLGNFVDLAKLAEYSTKYSNDAVRFYMLRAAPFGNDLDFSASELKTSYLELGNVLGNLLNRTLNMIAKYRDGVVPQLGEAGPEDDAVKAAIAALPTKLTAAYEDFVLQDCVTLPLEVARGCEHLHRSDASVHARERSDEGGTARHCPQPDRERDARRARRPAAGVAGEGKSGVRTAERFNRRQNVRATHRRFRARPQARHGGGLVSEDRGREGLKHSLSSRGALATKDLLAASSCNRQHEQLAVAKRSFVATAPLDDNASPRRRRSPALHALQRPISEADGRRRAARLLDHRGELAAVVRAVVDDVQDHVPQRQRVGRALRVVIRDRVSHLLGRHAADEIDQRRMHERPALFNGHAGRELDRVFDLRRTLATETTEPHPLGGHAVDEQLVNRADADAELFVIVLIAHGARAEKRLLITPTEVFTHLAKVQVENVIHHWLWKTCAALASWSLSVSPMSLACGNGQCTRPVVITTRRTKSQR